jgi:hypothetical protein
MMKQTLGPGWAYIMGVHIHERVTKSIITIYPEHTVTQ